MEQNSSVKASVKALLTGAIDYAGLFPPTALSMPEAVINYATYRNSNYDWMLGRFVVSASRLGEFYESARDFISRDAANAWRVAVVAGDDAYAAIDTIAEFEASQSAGVICDVLELKVGSAEMIEVISDRLGAVTAYFEIAPGEQMPELIAALSARGHRAKLRTGGLNAESFPSSADVIRFVRSCLAANVPFKATAGLHHPIRCFKPLTYEANAASSTMHGFLNLFLMTGFAREGFKPAVLEDLMEEEFDEVFRFEDQSVTWRDEFRLNLWQLERIRSHGIQSFGSCSFDEPVADLQKLGVL